MTNRPAKVTQFAMEGGYRLSPTTIEYDAAPAVSSQITINYGFKNTGTGILPNNNIYWNEKYKVAYALIDKKTGLPETIIVDENANPGDFTAGNTYNFSANLDAGAANGRYYLGLAIVNTQNKNSAKEIALAITNPRLETGWYNMGEVVVGTGFEPTVYGSTQAKASISLAYGTPMIDGKITDEAWENAEWITINGYNATHANSQAPYASGKFKALWDESALYIIAAVNDPTLYGAAGYESSGGQGYMDGITVTVQEGDSTFAVQDMDFVYSPPQNYGGNNIVHKVEATVTDYAWQTLTNGYYGSDKVKNTFAADMSGYVEELKIPFKTPKTDADSIRFEVQLNDWSDDITPDQYAGKRNSSAYTFSSNEYGWQASHNYCYAALQAEINAEPSIPGISDGNYNMLKGDINLDGLIDSEWDKTPWILPGGYDAGITATAVPATAKYKFLWSEYGDYSVMYMLAKVTDQTLLPSKEAYAAAGCYAAWNTDGTIFSIKYGDNGFMADAAVTHSPFTSDDENEAYTYQIPNTNYGYDGYWDNYNVETKTVMASDMKSYVQETRIYFEKPKGEGDKVKINAYLNDYTKTGVQNACKNLFADSWEYYSKTSGFATFTLIEQAEEPDQALINQIVEAIEELPEPIAIMPADAGDIEAIRALVNQLDPLSIPSIEGISKLYACEAEIAKFTSLEIQTSTYTIWTYYLFANPGDSVAQMKANISGQGGTIVITDSTYTPVSDTSISKTNLKIRLFYKDVYVTEKTLIVNGDVSGDGIADTVDLIILKRHLSGSPIEGDYVFAANVNHDAGADALDLVELKKYMLGLPNTVKPQ